MTGRRVFLFFKLIFAVTGLLWFCLPLHSYAEIRIRDVYPFTGVMGKPLPVRITGQGIADTTRIAMNVNVRSATLGTVEGLSWKVALTGDLAFICTLSDLKIFNVKKTTNPVLLSTTQTPGKPVDVAVSGTKAYVIDLSGLQVIDVEDPENPVLMGYVALSGKTWSLGLSGSFAYVAALGTGLYIIDVADPAAPSLVALFEQTPGAADVVVRDGIAFVADSGDQPGLYLVDVENSSAPHGLGYLATDHTVSAVTLSGDYAFIAAGAGLYSVNISVLQAPVLAGSVLSEIGAVDVALNGAVAYVLGNTSGDVQAVDISNAEDLRPLWTVSTAGTSAVDIDVVDDKAYVTATEKGLQIIDIAKTPQDMAIGRIESGSAVDIQQIGDMLYVADQNEGLFIIDIQNPFSPVLTGSLATPGTSWKIAAGGTLVCVADGKGGVRIVDVTDPANPLTVATVPLTDASDVALSADLLLAADWETGLYVIDLTNPAHPEIIGQIGLSGNPAGLCISKNTLYVAFWDQGLQIVDLADPANPILKGTLDTPGTAYDLCVMDDTVYVADREGGIHLINVTDPEVPSLISSITTPGPANQLFVDGGLLYAACGDQGMQMINFENPAKPFLTGYVNTEGYSWGVAVKNNMACLADGSAGMVIVPLPMEIQPDTIIDAQTMLATLPSPLLPGDYQITLFDSDDRCRSACRITFSDQEPPTSTISPTPSDKGGCFLQLLF